MPMYLHRSIAKLLALGVILVPAFAFGTQPSGEPKIDVANSQLAEAWKKRYPTRQKAMTKRGSELLALRRDDTKNSIENAWQKIYQKKADEKARLQRRDQVIELLHVARGKIGDLKRELDRKELEFVERIVENEENFDRPTRLGTVAKFLQQHAAAKKILRRNESPIELQLSPPIRFDAR